MDIICARCGAHFDNIDGIRNHAKLCKMKEENFQRKEISKEKSSQKQNNPIEVIFPPAISFPKHPKTHKPFLGAFKDNELKKDDDRCCVLCNNSGLTAHIIHTKGYTLIDFYWCSHCTQALWEAQTYIR
jgi:hypothetical protein